MYRHAGVIGGGGAFGAYTVGKLSALKPSYDLVIGVSTGALIAVYAALEDWDRLVDRYTSVSQSDIFTVNPFNSKGHPKVGLTVYAALVSFATGRLNIGSSKALKNLIDTYFTKEDYDAIISSGKEVIVTTTNFTHKGEKSVVYHSIKNTDYETFKLAMWASCNVQPFMSPVWINGELHYDGGNVEVLPISHAVKLGAKKIDAYSHLVHNYKEKRGHVKNMFHLLGRSISLWRDEIEMGDIREGIINSTIKRIPINLSMLPHKLADNSLMFDKQLMRGWVEIGKAEV